MNALFDLFFRYTNLLIRVFAVVLINMSVHSFGLTQTLPVPSLNIDFDPASLEKLGAQYPDGQKFRFVEGKDGRPAIEFYGIDSSSVIKIPNRE